MLHLAQCYERAGKTASAWGIYREALEVANAKGDARAAIAQRRADRLGPLLLRLTIEVPKEHQLPQMTIQRDGVVVGAPQWSQPLPVDPGPHKVTVSAPGHRVHELNVELSKDNPRVVMTVPKLIANEPAPGLNQPIPGPVPEPEKVNTTPWRVASIGAGALGVAALIGGGVLGFTAKARYDDSEGSCNASNQCDQAGLDARRGADRQALASTVLIGAGAALVGTGVVLHFLTPKPKRSASANDARAPELQLGLGSLRLHGEF